MATHRHYELALLLNGYMAQLRKGVRLALKRQAMTETVMPPDALGIETTLSLAAHATHQARALRQPRTGPLVIVPMSTIRQHMSPSWQPRFLSFELRA